MDKIKFQAWNKKEKVFLPPATVAVIGDGYILRYRKTRWVADYSGDIEIQLKVEDCKLCYEGNCSHTCHSK